MRAVETHVAILIGIVPFAFVIGIGLQNEAFMAIAIVLALGALVYALFVLASFKCPNCGAAIDYFGEWICPKCSCALVLAATKYAQQWSTELGPETTQRIMDDFAHRKRLVIVFWGSTIVLGIVAFYFGGPRNSPTIMNSGLFAIFAALALIAGYATFFSYQCPYCHALLGFKYVGGWARRQIEPNFDIIRCPVCGVGLVPQALSPAVDEVETEAE